MSKQGVFEQDKHLTGMKFLISKYNRKYKTGNFVIQIGGNKFLFNLDRFNTENTQ
jgi:hypothetical protein